MNTNTINTMKTNINTTRPTPETDAVAWVEAFGYQHLNEDVDVVGAEFARQLERERDEARELQNVKVTKNGETHCLGTLIDLLERERDEAREQIASCAINTNVRLFDLVRQMRAPLHEDGLITDEEYFWLCGGCEMANSPEGGSPSPRRLEDYDVLSEKLKAMREAIREVFNSFADEDSAWLLDDLQTAALAKLKSFIP